jgi:hypothetical protein
VTQVVVDVLAIALTIAVLSRIAGTNPLFRAAQYLFVGVSLGLAFVIAYHQVLLPTARGVLAGDTANLVINGVPLVLGVLLLPRAIGRQELSWLANIPLAITFGVGAALVIGGSIAGTLVPQILDSARPIGGEPGQLLGTIFLTLATAIILAGFYYTIPRETSGGRVVAVASIAGHWILMIAFGFFFAATMQTYVSALTERLQFILAFFGLAR